MQVDWAAEESALLRKLAAADGPLSKAVLFGRSPGKRDAQVLQRLLVGGQVVNLLGRKGFALVTSADAQGRFSPRQLARAGVLRYFGGSLRVLRLSTAGLSALKLQPYARAEARAAVEELQAEGQLIPLRIGSSNLVIAAEGVRRHLQSQFVSKASPAAKPPEPLSDSYRALLSPGRTMVKISELHRRHGGSLEALHAQLRQLVIRQGIFLAAGEPTVLDREDLAAGLQVDNKVYYYVEFV